MKIALFYLAAPRFGGWVTYTAHLAHSLTACGHDFGLYKVGRATEPKLRPFGYGIAYQNLSERDAYLRASRSDRSFITASDKSGVRMAGELAAAGASLVIHDPAEMKGPLLKVARCAARTITIRAASVQALAKFGVRAEFIKHPYVRAPAANVARRHNAVAFSRLDWDKHTDIICAANKILPPGKRIKIFGAENRLYTHNKLSKQFPGWRCDYLGSFQRAMHAGVTLARQARFCVDMSVIKGDGDGTQYTFLEAWDASAALVVNSGWIVTGKGAVRPGHTALTAADGDELAQILCGGASLAGITEAGEAELQKHSPSVIVREYIL